MDGLLEFPLAAPPAPGEKVFVAPGIWWLRMPLPFALDHINLWLLEDGEGWTLIDSGYGSPETRALWGRIFAESLDGRPLTRIIATHFHPDHIGLAGFLCDHFGAPFFATEKEWLSARLARAEEGDDVAALRTRFARRAGLDPAAALRYAERGKAYRRAVPSLPPSYHRLEEGMTLVIAGRRYEVIVGEGHAPEHASFYCRESRVLIAGDQVLPKISPNISLTAQEPEGDPLGRYLSSLDRLGQRVARESLVLPSHNLPFYGLKERIEALQRHHLLRCQEVLRACSRPRSAAELLPVLFPRRLDTHEEGFALGEALAHLNHLVFQGAIERSASADGVLCFSAANARLAPGARRAQSSPNSTFIA